MIQIVGDMVAACRRRLQGDDFGGGLCDGILPLVGSAVLDGGLSTLSLIWWIEVVNLNFFFFFFLVL